MRYQHLSEAEISAHLDDELSREDARRLEVHLAECEVCRRTLREYRLLGEYLRTPEFAVPGRLAEDLRARLNAPPAATGRAGSWKYPLAMAAATLLVLGVAAAIWWQSAEVLVAAAYPHPNATGVALRTAVEIVYGSNVDRQAVEEAVRIEPAVAVRKVWRGNTLVLQPEEELAPEQDYTVIAPQAAPASPWWPLRPAPAVGTPAEVTNFRTAPAVVAAAPSPTPAVGEGPTATLGFTGPAQPAGSPSPSTDKTPTPPPALAMAANPAAANLYGKAPVRGFGLVYGANPDVRELLGEATAEERGSVLVAQSFERGLALWQREGDLAYVLMADGRWWAHIGVGTPPREPAGMGVATATDNGLAALLRGGMDDPHPLGRPISAEEELDGAVQPFVRGLMLWTERGGIYVLSGEGRWREFPDLFEEPTSTATATPAPAATGVVQSRTPPAGATATRTPTITPTGQPAPVATAGRTELACTFAPVRGFGLLYAEEDVRDLLGCALEPERAVDLSRQTFQNGLLLWRGDLRTIYALKKDGTWIAMPDTYREGEDLSVEAPPDRNLIVPGRGFGKVWRQVPALRQQVGWALEGETGVTGAVQRFAGGQLLWTPDRKIYALYADGTWKEYRDRFPE